MTLEELKNLAIICQTLKKMYSSWGWGVDAQEEWPKRLSDMVRTYEEIFVEACETNRERVKHLLKRDI